MLKELRVERNYFGGGDGRAINKHSVRVYEAEGGVMYQLDRTLDGAPPFFQLVTFTRAEFESTTPTFPRTVKVGGEEYWGVGISWRAAEAKMRATVEGLERKEAADVRAN